MNFWTRFVMFATGIMLGACGNSSVTVKPDNAAMEGTWIVDRANSTCPPSLLSDVTKLVLNHDGTFSAQGFPKEISLGRQASVSGRWNLKHDGKRWVLDLPWETPSLSILDGAELVQKGAEIRIQFWIDDPDLNQRLVLRKRVEDAPRK